MAKAAPKTEAPPSHSHKRSQNVKTKRPVEVVAAASAFPVSSKPRQTLASPSSSAAVPGRGQLDSGSHGRPRQGDGKLLDWHATVKEVRNFGATAFVGQQKRDFVREQYKRLTGRDKKGQRIPLPIVRGIQKKAAQRKAKALEEAKAAGIVLPTPIKNKDKRKVEHSSRHGPTPSIGFISSNGVLKIKRKPI